MTYPGLMTDDIELVAVIHADLHNGEYYTPWLSAAERERWLFVLDVGDIGAGGAIAFEVRQAQDAVGTGDKWVKNITPLTQAGGDSDDTCCINVGTAEIDAAANFCYLRAHLTVLNASNCAVLVFARALRYLPPDTTVWTQIVS